MTIKGLHEFFRKKHPAVYTSIPMDDFAGYRIAVDLLAIYYRHLAIARRQVVDRTNVLFKEPDSIEIMKVCNRSVLNWVLRLMEHRILPVLVLDGPNKPSKEDTLKKRQQEKEEARKLIDGLLAQVVPDPLLAQDVLREKLVKAWYNYNNVPFGAIDQAKNLFRSLGFPFIQATGEAEKLCAILCREGHVAAMYSNDGDSLVYGCPLLILDIEKGTSVFKAIRYRTVLRELGLKPAQFTELAIMSGCDYNRNIPFFAIGYAYNALKAGTVTCIEDIPAKLGHDITILNHLECRSNFSVVPSTELIVKEVPDVDDAMFRINRDIFIEFGRDALVAAGIDGMMEKILALTKKNQDNLRGTLPIKSNLRLIVEE